MEIEITVTKEDGSKQSLVINEDLFKRAKERDRPLEVFVKNIPADIIISAEPSSLVEIPGIDLSIGIGINLGTQKILGGS